MKRYIYWLFILVMIIGLTPFSSYADDYDHSIDLNQMKFHWKVDGNNLNVMVSGKTTGWVAIGFNPSRKMKDANIIIGYVKGDQVEITDQFGTAYTRHSTDTEIGGKANMTNVSGSEKNSITTLKFTIPLNSGDSKDGVIQVNGMTTMIFALGARDSFRMGHRYRSTVKVNLSNGQYKID